MNFIELARNLEGQLGYHQIPINPRATNIKNLFESGPLHHDLIVRVMREVYQRNRCRSLGDAVNRDATFEALTPIRLSLHKALSTDVDAYHLMEDLCTAVARSFDEMDTQPSQRRRRRERDASAKVIDIKPFLKARRFKTWVG